MHAYVWSSAYAKAACTLTHARAPRRKSRAESYTIYYIDYINRASTCARVLAWHFARARSACRRNELLHCVGCSSMCATCARRACTHARTQRNIVAMHPGGTGGCVFIYISSSEYRYYWILLSTIILGIDILIHNWARIESVNLTENVTPKSLFFGVQDRSSLWWESTVRARFFLAYTVILDHTGWKDVFFILECVSV